MKWTGQVGRPSIHAKWTGQHRAFIIETFIKNESVTAPKKAFRLHYELSRYNAIPTQKTILLWVSNFTATESVVKRKSIGRSHTARTPENVEDAYVPIQQCPWRSTRKHAAVVVISIRSLRRIFHNDQQLNVYKMIVVKDLCEGDKENR